MRKNRFLAAIIILCMLLVTGCSSSVDDASETKLTGAATDAPYNFAELAKEYLETIGNEYPDRNSSSKRKAVCEWIIEELEGAGYSEDQIEIQKFKNGLTTGRNIILTVKGEDDSKQIIAGAHYDGDGIGDNGSGTALLLAEAVGLKDETPSCTVKYVFFDLEERGCIGSAYYSESMSKAEVQSTEYMINLDSLGFGDYCNVYGGHYNSKSGQMTRTEGYEKAMSIAASLGINTYGTEKLDGYYARNGKGIDLDPKGLFTNPWTASNPSPGDYWAYSPATIPASDHEFFDDLGITYIYFEATNWFAEGAERDDSSFSGYYDTGDLENGDNGMFMNTEYDTLANIEKLYPGRAMEHFNVFSPVVSALILNN